MIKSKHKLINCGHCGRAVICSECGNNTCNGGYGEVAGKTCDKCEDAYQMDNMYGKDYKSVVFANSHEFIELSDPFYERHRGLESNSKELNDAVENEDKKLEERNAYARTLPKQ